LGIGYHDFRAGHPFMPKLLSIMQKMDIDIIHAHSPFIAMTVARQLRQFLKIPIVFTQHTKWDYDLARAIPIKPVVRNVERFIYSNISAANDVWAVSRQTGEYLVERGYKGDFFVMPNGTDFPKGVADELLLKSIYARFDLPDNVPVLLFVGRMMWYKGIGLIIEALELLKKRGFDFRMIFIGDGEDLAQAKKMAMSKRLNHLIHFTGRVNDREELRAYYTIANLFILPSVYDNAPLVLQEAAACSCPSLVVRGSSAAEIIMDSDNGYHSELCHKSIADCVCTIFSDRERHENVALAASQRLYTPWSKVAELSVERYKVVKNEYDKKRRVKKFVVLKKRVKRLRALGIDHPRFR
jgi:glycosyltransferase involved in cell wall biosynthesis